MTPYRFLEEDHDDFVVITDEPFAEAIGVADASEPRVAKAFHRGFLRSKSQFKLSHLVKMVERGSVSEKDFRKLLDSMEPTSLILTDLVIKGAKIGAMKVPEKK